MTLLLSCFSTMQGKHQKPDSTDMHRLFVALLPDTRTIHRLTALQAGIKGRKTPPENLHLTLMFLGNQDSTSIPKLKAFIETLDFKAFDLCIDRRGFFSRLKINWVGASETPPLLVKLHEDIWSGTFPDPSSVDGKDLSAHISHWHGMPFPQKPPYQSLSSGISTGSP